MCRIISGVIKPIADVEDESISCDRMKGDTSGDLGGGSRRAISVSSGVAVTLCCMSVSAVIGHLCCAKTSELACME